MVALHCVGYTNREIAKQYEYSEVQVSNILRSPKSQQIIKDYKDKLRSTTATNESERMAAIKEKAITHVENLMNNDELAADHPFKFADFSVSILRGLGSLNSDTHSPGPAAAPDTNIMIGNDIATKLLDGMQKAQEAKRLNAPKTEIVVEQK